MDQALNSQKTPHTSPLRASYGMSFVSILMKNDRVIKGSTVMTETMSLKKKSINNFHHGKHTIANLPRPDCFHDHMITKSYSDKPFENGMIIHKHQFSFTKNTLEMASLYWISPHTSFIWFSGCEHHQYLVQKVGIRITVDHIITHWILASVRRYNKVKSHFNKAEYNNILHSIRQWQI